MHGLRNARPAVSAELELMRNLSATIRAALLVLRQSLSQHGVIYRALIVESVQPFGGFERIGVDREPVAGVAHRQAPYEVAPEVRLLLSVADNLRHLVQELGRHGLHGRIQL